VTQLACTAAEPLRPDGAGAAGGPLASPGAGPRQPAITNAITPARETVLRMRVKLSLAIAA
jgi:hypothetical protein